jgi:hypothetical protein
MKFARPNRSAVRDARAEWPGAGCPLFLERRPHRQQRQRREGVRDRVDDERQRAGDREEGAAERRAGDADRGLAAGLDAGGGRQLTRPHNRA